jgi:hypothetical protein
MFLLGNARAQSGAVDGEERRVMGDRGGCLGLSRFTFSLHAPFGFCLGLAEYLLCVVPSFVLQFVSVAVRNLVAGPNAST